MALFKSSFFYYGFGVIVETLSPIQEWIALPRPNHLSMIRLWNSSSLSQHRQIAGPHLWLLHYFEPLTE